RVRNSHGLLEDFFLHVMPVRTELDFGRGEAAHVYWPLNGFAARVDHVHTIERYFGAIPFLEVHDTLRDLHQRRSVRRREVLALSQAEEQWRTHTRNDEPSRIVFMDDGNSIGSGKLHDTRAHGIE